MKLKKPGKLKKNKIVNICLKESSRIVSNVFVFVAVFVWILFKLG